jgi:hypothetical protein
MTVRRSPTRKRLDELYAGGITDIERMWGILRGEGLCTDYYKFKRMIYEMRQAGDLPKRPYRRGLPTRELIGNETYYRLCKKAESLNMSYYALCCKILVICAKEDNLIDNILDED